MNESKLSINRTRMGSMVSPRLDPLFDGGLGGGGSDGLYAGLGFVFGFLVA